MTPILPLLHLCDSLFPLGGFGYSEGLEAATAAGHVSRADDLRQWLDVILDETILRCDGPAILEAWPAFYGERWDRLTALDEELQAIRPSSTARASSRAMGSRLLKAWHSLHPDARLGEALARVRAGTLGPSLPVAFAGACVSAGVDARASVEGYAYTRLAGTISSAMRLMAIGQSEAHALLARTLDRVPASVDAMLERPTAPQSFTPALDVALMTQQYVHSRLFRS